ncbi:acetyl-CoA acyltransferase [Kribbella sp. VKM Ac-2527]|uniref:Acetyl-CoA acyltransferase n=1 Tax=Kribbella caucasensis TaxID=2512215 RepID=A0A4R6KE14_9ACTN|nr:thiolase family protein [Kribbella sp. VKM Ac-2527]TDO48708.1 acetyl-CoA acyltransferase [Kribbella sp. VKM Ac-2527]
MSTPNAVIVDAIRSPMGKGKPGGALAEVHPVDLLAQTLSALLERTGVDPALVDDVLVGCVGQNGEQSANVGRQAWLGAGFPTHVPATTIERKCGSGQQAVDFAVQGVRAGAYDIVVAAGVESMSRVPMGSGRQSADVFGPRVRERFPVLAPQGVSAELVAHKWGFTREQLDQFSVDSHARAAQAASSGGFKGELVPIDLPDGRTVAVDETIRPGTTLERLAGLQPVFGTELHRSQFPEVEWKVTAGNSSQLTDGAAALLIMSEETAERLSLTPRARVVGSAVVGDDPLLMLTGPIPATQKLLDRTRTTLDDLDVIEVNEAFAPVPLAWLAEFPVDPALLNPRGGAIALGHPLGASGTRIMTTMINHLEQTGGRYGLQTMCEAGGMANATLIEVVR